jgi:hypothetical protein
MTLNPPVRVVALAGALVLTGLAAIVFLVGRGPLGGATEPTEATQLSPTTHVAPSAHVPAKPHVAAPRHIRVPTGFPAKIDHALRYGDVVVVSVSIPGARVDAEVRREARAAAKAAHARFIPLNALDEHAMSSLVAKAGVLPDPAIVIVKRPGAIASTFSVTDSETIAQAIVEARR